jgi:bacteriocin-like protein
MKDNEFLPIEGELTDEDLKQVSGGCVGTNNTGPPPLPCPRNQDDQGQDNNDQGQNQQ